MRCAGARPFVVLACLSLNAARADVAPGDLALRSDLQTLADQGGSRLLQTTWPIPAEPIESLLASISTEETHRQALSVRLRQRVERANRDWQFTASYTNEPVIARTFDDTSRGELEATIATHWPFGRWFADLAVTASDDPFESTDAHLDGTRAGVKVGNWQLSAGWEPRWWGPGFDGNLILSTNARPAPGITLKRASQTAFKSRWLSWIGPWSLVTFMDVLDDERGVEDALLWGARVTFMPLDGVEFGLSRTAQWCGRGRSCSLGVFSDVLLGNDNRGVNVSFEDEPGNQLAGVDVRARLGAWPAAVYAQWIGEDTRQGGPEIGSWLRQLGVETWGSHENGDWRMHVEVSDTTCREGGLGLSNEKPGCAYNHPIYSSGYRYGSRAIGHGIDGDGRSFSFGATLVHSADSSLSVILRHMDINRFNIDRGSRLSARSLDITEGRFSMQRRINDFPIKLSVGYRRGQGTEATVINDGAYVSVSWRLK